MTTGAPPVGRDWMPSPRSADPRRAVVVPRQRVGATAAPHGPVLPVPPSSGPPASVPRSWQDCPSGARRASSPAPPSRLGRLLVAGLLNLAALAGLAMTGVTVYAATHGMRPLVVRSGSMEPIIHTGSMVLVKDLPAADVRVGDVVAVTRPDGVTVTHRVVNLSRSGVFAQLTLKGDANKANDPEPVTVAEAGRLVWSAPVLGRIAAFTASARGGFVLGCLITAGAMSLRRRPG